MKAGHLYIALTILLTVYGQLILKWQMSQAGALPVPLLQKLSFLVVQLKNPWVLSALGAAFAAALCWMAALTTFELSYAYPFMSLAFAIVLAFGLTFLGETATPGKIVGLALILVGIVVSSYW